MTKEDRIFTLVKRLEGFLAALDAHPKIKPRGRPPKDGIDRLRWHITRFTKQQSLREKEYRREIVALKTVILHMARQQSAFLEKLQEYNPEHIAAVSRDYFLTRPERPRQ